MKKLDARFISGIDLTDIPEIDELTGNEILVIDDGTGNKITSIDKIISHGRPGPELVTTDNSVLFTIINENDTKVCKIKDYNSDLNYTISANKGSIGPIQSDGTFTYTAPDITDSNDTTDTISIYYTFATMMSATSRYDLTIKYVSVEADGVLSNTDFIANKSQSTNGLTVNTNSIKFDIENNISILSNTTNTELHTLTNINTSNRIVLAGNDKITNSGYPDNVTETSLIDAVDVFNDGSGIALYKFDGNANDTSGDYNGTWSGTEQYDAGKFGQAAKFDGSSQVNCGKINTSLDELLISFWMYWNGTYDEMLIGFYKYDLYISDDGYFGWNTSNGDRYGIDFPTSEYANRWLHIVVNFKTSDYGDAMYINDVKQNLSQKRNTINSSNAVIKNVDLHISGWGYDSGYKFNGLIDQVRIFNRALTEKEVAILYNEKKYLADISSFNLTNPPTKAWFVEEYYENPVEQESVDTDWGEIKDTTIYYKPNEITVLSDTTATDLSTTTEVVQSQPVILIKQDNTVITGNLGTVTETSPIDVVDVFNDGSGIALYKFDGNANDTSGDYNGTWSGTEQYDAGKFGQAAVVQRSNGNIDIPTFGSVFNSENNWAICLWVMNDSSYLPIFTFTNINGNTGFGKMQDNNTFTIAKTNNSSGNYYLNVNEECNAGDFIVFNKINYNKVEIYKNNTLSQTLTFSASGGGNITGNSIGSNYVNGSKNVYLSDNTTYILDQFRIFNRALTAEEVNILYNEKKYLADISSYNLDNPPIKAFKDDKINVYIDIENTKQSIVDDVDPFKDNSGIALYQFDGNANDTGGNYNGTWSGTAQYDTGKFGQAAKFDGSSYIATPLTGNDFPGDITISVWIYNIVDNSNNQQIIQDRHDSNSNYKALLGIAIDFRNSQRYIKVYGGNGSSSYSCTYNLDNIDFSIPHHLVAIRTNSNIKLYFDNILVNSISSGSMYKSNSKYYIGGNYSSSNLYGVNGLIDQVRIFNRALTEQEVSALYNEEWYKFQNFDKVSIKELNYNNSNLISVYDDYSKTGRAIQRKIEIENKNVEVVTPFNSDLYKYTT